jgi:poly-beta-1,6-N-acetyl-D-glucosamine synthase
VLHALVYWSLVLSIVYLAMVYAIDFMLVGFATVENVFRNHDRESEDFDVLEASRFTIPVSVIVPVHNEEAVILPVLASLLAMRYPEFEVVVVNDGSTDASLNLIREEYDLEPREVFFRRLLDTDDGSSYRSRRDARLSVVDKALGGGKANALNTGLNHARYPYVCCVDGDTIYFEDALLKGMRLALRDPERVIGVTSQIAVAERPEEKLTRGRSRLDRSLLSMFQHLEYLRAFLNDRLAWSRLGFMLCASGAFMVWRRDVLVELGGFSSRFTCEDIEITFRAHEHHLREHKPYDIIALPDAVARTEGPQRLRALLRQRERWHRVVLETVWHYRGMFMRRKYGAVGLLGMPFYLLSEVLAPFFELLAIVSLVLAIAIHLFDPFDYLLFFGLMSFALATFTATAILLDDQVSRSYPLRDLTRLLILSPAELILYRPALVWARVRAVWSFARGEKQWDKFERNPRNEDSPREPPERPARFPQPT